MTQVSANFLFGCVFCPGLPGLLISSWLPCLLRRVAPNPRIQRSEFVNSYQQQPVCCLVLFFFILSPSQDLMHCTSGFVHTLPTEQASSAQQIFFCGVMTPTLLPVRPGLHLTDVGLL